MSDQKTYTSKEIEADVLAFEGLKIICDHPGPFLRLYSQHYSEPLNGDSTVDQFKERFVEFIQYRAIHG